jgi:adenosylhomocysteine nucleosidase
VRAIGHGNGQRPVRLVVLGVSGGLKSGLGPGDLIVADSVMGESREGKYRFWKPDPPSVARAHAVLAAEGLQPYRGAVLTTHAAALSAGTKGQLFDKTQALAVDMESAPAARAATEANLPFFVLRTVCDTAGRSVSGDLFACFDERGRIRLPIFLRKFLQKPSLFFDMCYTGKSFAAAAAALKKAWAMQIKANLPRGLISGGDRNAGSRPRSAP